MGATLEIATHRSGRWRRPGPPAIAAAGAVLGCLLLTAGALILCGGVFTYSFDDPYITLTLARRILEGTYGINPGESASPSSSILYPLILAPFAAFNAELLAPWLLNTAAAGVVGAVFAVLIREAAPGASDGRVTSLAVVLTLAAGVVALPLVGLEHGLHAALTAAAFLGARRLLQTGRAPPWLAPVLVALPLVRFEGAALELMILAALVLRRQWTVAAATTLATALALLAWGLVMHALGLPFLPSSVLVKLAAEHQLGRGLISEIATHLAPPPVYRFAPLLVVETFVVAFHPVFRILGVLKGPPSRIETPLAAIACGALAAHLLVAGRTPRYDVYANTLAWCAIVWLWLPHLAGVLRAWTTTLLAEAAVLVFAAGFVGWTLQGPDGSRAVFEQQAQIRRLAVEFYRGPIAVNDIGEVSYRNPYGVLDLWGLGSEEVRLARAKGEPGWMGRVVAEHRVGMAAIYSPWFAGQVPASWTRVGVMTNRHDAGLGGGVSVDVYATSPQTVAAVRAALVQLRSAAKDQTQVSIGG